MFPKGTTLEASAWFDNSPANRFNPDPTTEVSFGDQTWDERMVDFVRLVLASDQDLSGLIKQPTPKPSAAGQ